MVGLVNRTYIGCEYHLVHTQFDIKASSSAPIIGAALYAPGIELLFLSMITYLATSYSKYAGSVLAGNNLVRGCTAAAFP